MKKLLVLGAGTYQLPLIREAKNQGVYVITITPEGPYDGIHAADKVYFHDARDEQFALEVGRKESIDGVISDQSELFVRPVAYVAEKMGLIGNSHKTACLYTNKQLMREKSKALGLPTIESVVVKDVSDAIAAYKRLDGKAIIKPVDSFSSHGVSKIDSMIEIEEKFRDALAFSISGEVIIERYITGPQFEVDSLAVNGRIVPLMYADLTEFSIPNVFSSAMRLYPSVADSSVIKKLLNFNNIINKGFGMKMGVSHNEYIMDEATGEIYLIEAALRGGGTFIASEIASLQSGIDTANFLVNAALGEIKDIPSFKMNCCHAGYVCFYLPEGEIVQVRGIEEVKQMEGVVKTRFTNICEGNKTKSIEDKDQRHVIVLFAESREEILKKISIIKKTIDIKVLTQDGIKGPIWE